ncbi:polysaccharide pyruvyl transferase family protein [Lactiplantibacillus nangangensis]|uniref:Polysaccharide pyruvyl transferase family protein n=1 Tax=Lactiplantibacillus nangangensis TaxID=2559917 RepID=A0ABW1SK44_9LACO|nr:polysaccharide pyruvyl transferase family protein [Lactiplantibacillus nangangensis]
MKRIAVKGYFNRNLGDDLLLKALLEHFPEIMFYILVAKKDVTHYQKLGQNLRVVSKNLVSRCLLRGLDMVKMVKLTRRLLKPFVAYVELGGAIFQQRTAKETVNRLRSGVQLSQKPYFIIGSNFGPVSTDRYTNEYETFFSKINSVVFRDTSSYNLFSNLKQVAVAPDAALSLSVTQRMLKACEKPYVVMTPIDLRFTSRILSEQYSTTSDFYEGQMKRLAEALISSGYEIKIMAFSEAEGDEQAARRIARLIVPKFQKHVGIYTYQDIPQLFEMMAGAERLISGRFHAMILGWLFQKPQLVVTYSDKTKNVIADCFPEQHAVPTKMLAQIEATDLEVSMNTVDSDSLAAIQADAMGHFEPLEVFLQKSAVMGHQ